MPLLVIFGAEDQVFDAEQAVEGYADVPGVQTEIVDEAGHAPQVEQPEAVATLLDEFSVDLEPAEPPQTKRGRDQRDRPKAEERGKRSKKDRDR